MQANITRELLERRIQNAKNKGAFYNLIKESPAKVGGIAKKCNPNNKLSDVNFEYNVEYNVAGHREDIERALQILGVEDGEIQRTLAEDTITCRNYNDPDKQELIKKLTATSQSIRIEQEEEKKESRPTLEDLIQFMEAYSAKSEKKKPASTRAAKAITSPRGKQDLLTKVKRAQETGRVVDVSNYNNMRIVNKPKTAMEGGRSVKYGLTDRVAVISDNSENYRKAMEELAQLDPENQDLYMSLIDEWQQAFGQAVAARPKVKTTTQPRAKAAGKISTQPRAKATATQARPKISARPSTKQTIGLGKKSTATPVRPSGVGALGTGRVATKAAAPTARPTLQTKVTAPPASRFQVSPRQVRATGEEGQGEKLPTRVTLPARPAGNPPVKRSVSVRPGTGTGRLGGLLRSVTSPGGQQGQQ